MGFEVFNEEGCLDMHKLEDTKVAEVGNLCAAMEELFHVLLYLR